MFFPIQPSVEPTCIRGPLYTLTDYHVSNLVAMTTKRSNLIVFSWYRLAPPTSTSTPRNSTQYHSPSLHHSLLHLVASLPRGSNEPFKLRYWLPPPQATILCNCLLMCAYHLHLVTITSSHTHYISSGDHHI